jgi:hypothetical protein
MAPEARLLTVLSRRLLGRARVVSDSEEIGDDRPQASLPVSLPGQLAHLKKAKAARKREALQTTTGLVSAGPLPSPLFYRSLSLVTYRREMTIPYSIGSIGFVWKESCSVAQACLRFTNLFHPLLRLQIAYHAQLPQSQLSQLLQLCHLWPRPSS